MLNRLRDIYTQCLMSRLSPLWTLLVDVGVDHQVRMVEMGDGFLIGRHGDLPWFLERASNHDVLL